jgi:hypothetical protein
MPLRAADRVRTVEVPRPSLLLVVTVQPWRCTTWLGHGESSVHVLYVRTGPDVTR